MRSEAVHLNAVCGCMIRTEHRTKLSRGLPAPSESTGSLSGRVHAGLLSVHGESWFSWPPVQRVGSALGALPAAEPVTEQVDWHDLQRVQAAHNQCFVTEDISLSHTNCIDIIDKGRNLIPDFDQNAPVPAPVADDMIDPALARRAGTAALNEAVTATDDVARGVRAAGIALAGAGGAGVAGVAYTHRRRT